MLRLDTGNTGFMLLCSSLVMLMTPGLAFFYGGLVGRKNVLAIMIQSFVSLCWTTVIWYVCGYSLCFSGDVGGVIGNLDMAFLRGVNLMAPSPNDSIPLIVLIAYQMMFAIITPALITGRVRQPRDVQGLLHLPHALAAVRVLPVRAHGVGRRAAREVGRARLRGRHRGAQHRRHRRAGLGALRRAAPRRRTRGRTASRSWRSGTGLLWFGWYGFNAGSEFRVDAVTATAFLNTDLAASFAGMAWFLVEWMSGRASRSSSGSSPARSPAWPPSRRPRASCLPRSAALIGIVAGVVCFYAVALKNKLQWDDALDVWGVHGVGGFIGIIMLGVFATQGLQPGGRRRAARRQSRRSSSSSASPLLLSSVWAFVFTLGMLWLIDRVTPVKVAAGTEEIGLDEALHGERAYIGEL